MYHYDLKYHHKIEVSLKLERYNVKIYRQDITTKNSSLGVVEKAQSCKQLMDGNRT